VAGVEVIADVQCDAIAKQQAAIDQQAVAG
jgi:hypothetical protein